jgi:hypothetical protein
MVVSDGSSSSRWRENEKKEKHGSDSEKEINSANGEKQEMQLGVEIEGVSKRLRSK